MGVNIPKGFWLCPEVHDDSKQKGDNNVVLVKKNTVSSVKVELQVGQPGGQESS